MANLQDRLARLSASQRAVVAVQALARGRNEHLRIPRRPDPGRPVPASFAQERLWFVESLRPGHGAYNISLAVPLHGPLSPRVVSEALQLVVTRHEALRTTLVLEGDHLIQAIAPPAPITVPLLDLQRMPVEERLREIDRVVERELDRGFDLTAGPVVRAVLVRLRDDDHTLLVTTHHICSDGWSVGILRREVIAACQALARGALPRWSPLPIQYADYSVWQRARHADGAFAPLITYWRRELAGAPGQLALPFDGARPDTPSLAGLWHPVGIDAAAVERLARLARAARTTPFVVLLAAYAVALHRLSGQDDVVIGIPIASRNRLELEGLIGFFVNALPIRVRLRSGDRFADVVDRVRDTAVAAYQVQDLPFEKLVEELQPERVPGRHPVFQATFSFQNLPGRVDREAAIDADPEHRADVLRGSIKFDLSLHLREAGGAISGSLGLATELFSEATGAHLAALLIQVIAAGTAQPEQRLDELAPVERAAAGPPAADPPAAELPRAGERLCGDPTGLALAGSDALPWPAVVAQARAQLAADPTGAIDAIDATAPRGYLIAMAAAMLGGRDVQCAGATVSSAAMAAIARQVGEAVGLSPGASIAVGPLVPRAHLLAAALAIESGACLAPSTEADPTGFLDHVTWEGANAAVIDAQLAAGIAFASAIPLQGIALVIAEGQVTAATARRLRERGATGVVVSEGPGRAPGGAARRSLVSLDELAERAGPGDAAPAGERATPDAGAIEAGPVSEALAAIWHDVLGHTVGLDDDFFAAGGHSLRAIQAVARIRDLLRVPLPVAQVFTSRTVRQMAGWLAEDPERAAMARRAAEELRRVAAMTEDEVVAELRARGEEGPWT